MKRKPLTKKQKIMAMASVVAGVGVVGYYLYHHHKFDTFGMTPEEYNLVVAAMVHGIIFFFWHFVFEFYLGRDDTLNKIFDRGEKGYHFTSPEHGRCLFKATKVS